MSSTTITVKPKRRSARSPPPVPVEETVPKGTVLLRQPLPKYSFQVSKKKGSKGKLNENTSKDVGTVQKDETMRDTKSDLKESSVFQDKPQGATTDGSSVLSSANPVKFIIGEIEPPLQTVVRNGASVSLSSSSAEKVVDTSCRAEGENVVKEKPINKVDPVQNNTVSTDTPTVPKNQTVNNGLPPLTDSLPDSVSQSSETSATSLPPAVSAEDLSRVGILSQRLAVTGSHVRTTDCADQIKALEKENEYLKSQLNVQLQVNAELKKLLIASLGEDLHGRVERLTRDKAELSHELGGFTKKVTEDLEHLDKISIQADMWRSKYLASRVMADELASSKAFYSMQFQECQNAIHKLLNERHELKANLTETNRCLLQVKGAFDPLNSQHSLMPYQSAKNNLDLARANQQLADSIKYRLLPSNVTSSLSINMESDWHDYLTMAESHAQELLSREVRPEDFRHLVRPALMAPGHAVIDRYHPFITSDNLTFNVCCKCKGDISVV